MINITGRDNLITAKALAYAIITIERLPWRWQEASDKEDMRLLLEAMVPEPVARDMVLTQARCHIEKRPLDIDATGRMTAGRRASLEGVIKFPA